ncbi:MAG: molybdate ABC transporter permease subunit [Planctomycetota bacterium]|nr:MAG: molybdate ABC transporter permease subunit [Planctomycetota bacterium]
MSADAVSITLLTLRVGLVACAIILGPGVALGYVLARKRFWGRTLVQTVVMLPMVLPPVAVGLLLLFLFARRSPVGQAVESVFGAPLLLTWWAAALASAVMAFPMLVLGAQQGFQSVPRRLEQVAATLGASRRAVFFRVSLPLAARGILFGLAFAFARAIGEFGATTVVAGHIPGRTETLALAIYARIEQFEDAEALGLAAVSLALALAMTGTAHWLLRSREKGEA